MHRSVPTKTSFGPDGMKQGCAREGVDEGAAAIALRGKLYTDEPMVLSSPYRSLVLEAVLSVIGGESAQAVPTPFSRLLISLTLRAAAA